MIEPEDGPAHPLQMLTAGEIRAARRLLAEHSLLGDPVRFAYLGLDEPTRAEVLGHRPGDPVDRRIRAMLLDTATGGCALVVASLTRWAIDSATSTDPVLDGQPPILVAEFTAVDDIVKADAGWVDAMRRRGITQLDLVRACPLSAGFFDDDAHAPPGRRLLRVLSFLAHRPEDHCWAHPIDGIVAYVDLIDRRVVRLIDHEMLPIPEEEGNVDDPGYVGPTRPMAPIEITQPQGAGFTVDGHVVSWQGWTVRIGFDPREGLVLHQIGIRDGDRDRPVLYRASIAEMVVPYADPSPVHFWQNYFDAGEYLLGAQANSLALGCDCLGEIHYFDVVMADGDGEPRLVPNAICLHEEDFGIAWKHTDIFTGSAETRRQRRLVISFFATVGNYDYGFYWYLYLDGTIQCEVKATGVVFTSVYREGSRYATPIAPGLGAPYHQHLFCARLDMFVDGAQNAVDELDIVALPVGPENPHGNAFTVRATRLASELAAARCGDASTGRSWLVTNPHSTNRLGRPVGYSLRPQNAPRLLADAGSSIARRAAFATRHLWVSRYDPAQRYPAGDLVNQHPGGAGLPAFVAGDRDLDGQELVVWHTFGTTHVPRTEDWPVMPVEYCGFTLRPTNFFDRNPMLDLPAPAGEHCAPAGPVSERDGTAP